MNKQRLAYGKPSLQYWTSQELDSIEATMSGGGGYIHGTTHVTTHRYYAYFLIASGAVANFGHAELGLRDQKFVDGIANADNDRIFVYSFTADPGLVISNIVDGILTGVPGEVSCVVKKFSLCRYVTSVASLRWEDFKEDSNIYKDKTCSYEPDSLVDTLDKAIWTRIDESQYNSMKSAASGCVNSDPPQDISLGYAILQNNCGNFVENIFRVLGDLTINYDATASIAYAESIIGAVALWMISFATSANLPAAAIGTVALEAILNGFLLAASVDGSVPLIPNGVYDYFQSIVGSSYGSGTTGPISSC